jgi:hypothetical protein
MLSEAAKNQQFLAEAPVVIAEGMGAGLIK